MQTITPPRAALIERLVLDGDLACGDDLDYVEHDDAVTWLSNPGTLIDAAVSALDDGVAELTHADLKRLNTLLIRVLSPAMSADDLLELRDLLRSALLDGSRQQLRTAIDDTVDFARVAHARERDAAERKRVSDYWNAKACSEDALFETVAQAVRP